MTKDAFEQKLNELTGVYQDEFKTFYDGLFGLFPLISLLKRDLPDEVQRELFKKSSTEAVAHYGDLKAEAQMDIPTKSQLEQE